MGRFTSYGGGIHFTAIIGHPPQDRRWARGDKTYEPLLGEDVRVEAFVTVDAGYESSTYIGDRTWLMKGVHVGHDARIGMDCELPTGTVIGGYAEIGDRVRFGINATVLPYVEIGDDARIGAGSVVTKDVPPGEVWAGNPARSTQRASVASGHLRLVP